MSRRDGFLQRDEIAAALQMDERVRTDDIRLSVGNEAVYARTRKSARRDDDAVDRNASVEHRDVAQHDPRRVGVSPADAPRAFRAQEAAFAEGWFHTITAEVFG